MTLCPSPKPRDHDAVHLEARLVVPFKRDAPVRVEVLHECQTWGCPIRHTQWTEQAKDPEGLLRKLLAPRGMIAPGDSPGLVSRGLVLEHDPSRFPGCTYGTCEHPGASAVPDRRPYG